MSDIDLKKLTFDQAKDLARTYLEQEKLEEARSIIQKLHLTKPMDAEIDILAATCELRSGHVSVARSLVLKANRTAPHLDKVKTAVAELEKQDRNPSDNKYLNRFFNLRNWHMDYPMNIQIETVGRCNAKCDFCPHSELDRKTEAMSDELFEKIVNDISAIPSSSPLNIFMNVVNEPFMDKKIFPRMRQINNAVAHATIGIYTNMNVMPPLFFEKLAEIRNINAWNISFNAANKEEYEQSMMIDFGRTVNNIKRLLNENRKRKFLKDPICLSRIGTGDEADMRFIEECQSLFSEYKCNEEFRPAYKNRADWLGSIPTDGQSQIPSSQPCQQWFNISVFCNGIVPHCCMDAKGEFPFGDVNKQSVLEIYNSPQFRNLRENVMSRDVIYPCNTCALL
jgi:hypothetical protein